MARKKRKTARRKKKSSFFENIKQGICTVFAVLVSILPAAIMLAVFVGLFFGVREVLYADAVLNVRQIQVSPAEGVSVGRRQELENTLLGKNILKVDLKSIAKTLQTNPQIQTATVNRLFPNTLDVKVTTRTPAAFIRLSPGSAYGLISEDGMILDVTSENNASLVTIYAYGLEMNKPKLGKQIRDRGLSEALIFSRAFSNQAIAQTEILSGMSVDKSGALTITLGSGPDIRLGRQPSTRLATLGKIIHLLESDKRSEIDYIDLRFDNVIVKRK